MTLSTRRESDSPVVGSTNYNSVTKSTGLRIRRAVILDCESHSGQIPDSTDYGAIEFTYPFDLHRLNCQLSPLPNIKADLQVSDLMCIQTAPQVNLGSGGYKIKLRHIVESNSPNRSSTD